MLATFVAVPIRDCSSRTVTVLAKCSWQMPSAVSLKWPQLLKAGSSSKCLPRANGLILLIMNADGWWMLSIYSANKMLGMNLDSVLFETDLQFSRTAHRAYRVSTTVTRLPFDTTVSARIV